MRRLWHLCPASHTLSHPLSRISAGPLAESFRHKEADAIHVSGSFSFSTERKLSHMTRLTSLQDCVAQALTHCVPLRPEAVAQPKMTAGFLAQDLCLTHDLPPQPEALRAGFAVAALDVLGASVDMPVPLGQAVAVTPGRALPLGCDAVLTLDCAEDSGAGLEAICPVGPGEGVRHAGHDGRAGSVLAKAGSRLTPQLTYVAALAGVAPVTLRQPTIRVEIDDPVQAGFVQQWGASMGVRCSSGEADLVVRTTRTQTPRLAYAPAETAWMESDGSAVVLALPTRFDGLVAALLGLGIPAICHLGGASVRTVPRALLRKITSSVGLSELVLLAEEDQGWVPFPSGHLTLTSLAGASAFVILPPESEGLPAGAQLSAAPIDQPFC